MKKMMVLFGLLLFLCATVSGGQAEGLRAFESTRITASVLGSEQAAVLDTDGTLWSWPYDSSEPQAMGTLPIYNLEKSYYDFSGDELRKLEDAVFHLFEADGTLYALNPYAGRIGTIDSEGVHWTVDFDASGLVAPHGWAHQLDDLTAQGGTLYALLDRDELGKQVLTIELASGATTRFDAPDVEAMCLQGDRLLLAYLPMDDDMELLEGAGLMEMNPQTGETRMLPPRFPEGMGQLWGIAASEDAVYLLTSNCFLISRGDEDFQPLQNGPNYATDMRLLPGGRMAMRKDGIAVLPMAESPASERLIVRGNLSIWHQEETFIAAHPEALLQVIGNSLTPAEVAERIRGGDTETDVFIVRANASFGALLDKGYAAPLDDNPVIAASAEKLFPAIRNALTDSQGRLVAYPEEVNVIGWKANKELWQKHFGEQPLPTTYLELLRDLQAFLDMENEDGDLFFDLYDYQTMVQDVIEAHLAAHGDEARFHDPALRETLELLGQVQEALREKHLERWDEMELFFEEIIGLHSLFCKFIVYSTHNGNLVGSDRYAYVPLRVDGEPMTSGNLYAMLVNPSSAHQELAKAFIALVAQPDMDATRYAILHTDGQPTKQTNYAGEEVWKVSPEALEAWAHTTETLRFGERAPLRGDRMTEQIEALTAQYVDGLLTVDRLLDQLDEGARMILNEQ